MSSDLSAEQARELYERKLREICTDEQWTVYHRRLHPDEYPPQPPSFWTRLRVILMGH